MPRFALPVQSYVDNCQSLPEARSTTRLLLHRIRAPCVNEARDRDWGCGEDAGSLSWARACVILVSKETGEDEYPPCVGSSSFE